ncbi:MAG: dihydroneopterin aldolase [Woeseiaceae bacterium]|jgi:dihydroneopterin aldolase|tara:strand:- start:135 stop:494 length:360 start_codon:yes stop_codon:yes gene_type:complete
MMDAIFLNEMRVETIVGIWDWERKTKQIVSIDLEMGADIKKAALTDNIEDTLNYKGVSKRIRKFVEDSDFQLVETMAEKIAEIILVEFNVPWVKVRVNKPGAIRGSKDVGVFITRTQES